MFDRNDAVNWFHSPFHDSFRLSASAGPYGWSRAVTSPKRSTACTITQRSCYRYHINRSHNEAMDSPISSDRTDTSRQDKKMSLNRKFCCILKLNNSPPMWVWVYPWMQRRSSNMMLSGRSQTACCHGSSVIGTLRQQLSKNTYSLRGTRNQVYLRCSVNCEQKIFLIASLP